MAQFETEKMLSSVMYYGSYFLFPTGKIVYQLDYIQDGVMYYHNVLTGFQVSSACDDTTELRYLPQLPVGLNPAE